LLPTRRGSERDAAEQGVYGGGSMLASQVMRQLFDCYSGFAIPGDNFAFMAGPLARSSARNLQGRHPCQPRDRGPLCGRR